MHDLCNVNGLIIGIVPYQGALNQGFFNYQPIFFERIVLANDYDMNLYGPRQIFYNNKGNPARDSCKTQVVSGTGTDVRRLTYRLGRSPMCGS